MKTVNLKLAKQLKESGYPQDKGFYWVGSSLWDETAQSDYETPSTPNRSSWVFAPTADEILDQLPKKINGRDRGVLHWLQVEIMEEGSRTDEKNGWSCQYFNPNFGVIHFEEALTLADAAVKMWLYLTKEGLL